jgi:hypothetical protein
MLPKISNNWPNFKTFVKSQNRSVPTLCIKCSYKMNSLQEIRSDALVQVCPLAAYNSWHMKSKKILLSTKGSVILSQLILVKNCRKIILMHYFILSFTCFRLFFVNNLRLCYFFMDNWFNSILYCFSRLVADMKLSCYEATRHYIMKIKRWFKKKK